MLLLAERALILLQEPLLDAVRMEDVSLIAVQRSYIVTFFCEFLHADSALVEDRLLEHVLVENNRRHGLDKVMLHQDSLLFSADILAHLVEVVRKDRSNCIEWA